MLYDAIIVGAGFAGAVAARQLCEQCGKKHVLVIEQRGHSGGNTYDCVDANGVMIHKYGPHIFHTNSERVYAYLSRFTQWRAYEHEVVAAMNGKFIPVPFNFHSIDACFDAEKAAILKEKLLAAYPGQSKVTILQLRQSTDADLKALGDFVYENVFVHYTQKQWGTSPEHIDPATLARVPVLLSEDDRYFQDTYQGMPLFGYRKLFKNLLDYPGIDLRLHTDARTVLKLRDGKIYFEGKEFTGTVVYTGAPDELFDNCLGALPYRTLDFKFETYQKEYYQPKGTVNYTVSEDFTRITEFKYLTGQQLAKCTTVMKEYSRAYEPGQGDTPYYAIINPENRALYEQYAQLAAGYPGLVLLGRLAEYRYYNMDAIILRVLEYMDDFARQNKTEE